MTIGTLDVYGNLTKMEFIDYDGNGSVFELDYRPDSLVVKINFPYLNYRGTFVLPPIDFSATPTRRVLEELKTGTFRRLYEAPGVRGASTGNERNLQGGAPAEVWIFTTECDRNADPSLTVTGVTGGSAFPVSVERQSEGFYKALFSVEDTTISDSVLGGVCSALAFSGNFCPVAPSTSLFVSDCT